MHKLVKWVWRKLPRRLRDWLLSDLITLVAPRPNSKNTPSLPIIVVGYLSQASGLGAAARACHDALSNSGLPVYGIDITSMLFQESDFDGFLFESGSKLNSVGTVLLHLPGPQIALAMTRLGRRFVQQKHIVAHWFWELPVLPEGWRSSFTYINGAFVNTQFVGDAVKSAVGSLPVQIVPYPLVTEELVLKQNTKASPFVVLVVFNVASNFARKNPCAAILAHRRAFGEDPSAKLILKFTNAECWPQAKTLLLQAAKGAQNIELIDSDFGPIEMDKLYQRADVVLSLHRSEGLGLVLAEAMARGLPVVATDWSGNSDFLNSETGFPIGYKLVPVYDPQGVYQEVDSVWAEPDIDEAAQVLQRLRGDLAMRHEIGSAAAASIAKKFSSEEFAERVKSLLGLENTATDDSDFT